MIAISDTVQVRKDSPSGTIVINRPARRNALSRETVKLIQQGFQDLLLESSVRAVILTGSGSTFCSGSDLHQLRETADERDSSRIWYDDVQDLVELIRTMLTYPRPIVAAVNGPVVGIGAALMLAADLVVASRQAVLQMPEARRGLSASLTAPLLAFRTNTGIASTLLLGGQPASAEQAQAAGVFHELVDDALVWARAQEWAQACAEGARESHQMTKRILNETLGESLETQLNIGAANMAAARTTAAAREGIAAFLEKREPDWGSLHRES